VTAAEELHAAATLLRDHLVSAATEGPWRAVEYDSYSRDTYGFEAGLEATPGRLDVVGHGYEGGGFDRLCDAQYVAAMHPGVGAAIANWLDDAAVDAEQIGANHHALAVARAILGQTDRSQP
jgi:hypothetical protein